MHGREKQERRRTKVVRGGRTAAGRSAALRGRSRHRIWAKEEQKEPVAALDVEQPFMNRACNLFARGIANPPPSCHGTASSGATGPVLHHEGRTRRENRSDAGPACPDVRRDTPYLPNPPERQSASSCDPMKGCLPEPIFFGVRRIDPRRQKGDSHD